MEPFYYNCFLVFLRISAFLFVLPFFSTVNFPVTLRIALGVVASILLAPMLPPPTFARLDLLSLVGLMIQEVSVGLLLGFVARVIFFVMDIAGTIIATEMGLNMAALVDPSTQQSGQAPSVMLFYMATMVMLSLNLHHWILLGFQSTYAVLPIGGAHLSGALFETIVRMTGEIFTLSLRIAAPIMAVSFVVMMVFTALGRAVPQMSVFAESFAFRIAAGLIVFGFTLQLAAQHVSSALRRLPDDLLGVAQILGGH